MTASIKDQRLLAWDEVGEFVRVEQPLGVRGSRPSRLEQDEADPYARGSLLRNSKADHDGVSIAELLEPIEPRVVLIRRQFCRERWLVASEGEFREEDQVHSEVGGLFDEPLMAPRVVFDITGDGTKLGGCEDHGELPGRLWS